MAHSMKTATSSFSTPVAVSAKPWFLTFDPENENVFILKNNSRLRVKDNESSGCVTEVAVLDESTGVLLVCCFGI